VHTPRKSNSLLVLLNTNAGKKSEMFIVGAGQPVRMGRLWSATWKEELLGEDTEHLIRLVHGFGQECAVAVAFELEGRRSARWLAGLLKPERVGDVEVPACLGPAA